MIKIKARAKINLTMDVLGKRSDGFHEVESVMQAVSLSDEISLELLPGGRLEFYCSDPLLNNKDNLAYRAAALLGDVYPGKGARISLEKKIPMAAGLGGGSSDAAAVLKGLNLLWGLELPGEKLLELAALLGSDVPFCLWGKTALAEGRGERLKFLPRAPHFYVLLAVPPDLAIPTASVYGGLVLQKIRKRPKTKDFLRFFYEKKIDEMAACMANVLEEVVFPRYPAVDELKRMMKKYAPCALMSGSGPSVFGLFLEKKRALLAEGQLAREGYRTYLADTCPS
ncbi:MAG: 4-(cytidine 5'-diphospho)-2-C-methyl-D-erythritol kinase [Firmicutes bacterium]|nr:4-(cytidine 5'-diphospho)-2-C-methyl-D-erythritol kinase [Bacillota bacterium]